MPNAKQHEKEYYDIKIEHVIKEIEEKIIPHVKALKSNVTPE